MRARTNKPRRGARRMVIGTATWFWRAGSDGVEIWAPDGTRHVTFASTVTGRTPDDIDCGRWKRTTDGMIRPRDIRAYIDRIATSM